MSPSESPSEQPSRILAAGGPAHAALSSLGPVDWGQWERAAAWLESRLAPGPARDRRIHQLYVPVLLWLAHAARHAGRKPLVVGLSAPQGAGKSTLVGYLVPLLAELGLHAVAVSIDDFYLSYAEQERLAAQHAGNPYLRYRGYPGTHDVALGTSTLVALRDLAAGGEVRVPVYDKSLHGGRGDRLPESQWRMVRGPLDLVIVEGWMLGFHSVASDRMTDAALGVVNDLLPEYEAWSGALDRMVILRATDPRHVLRWRVEAEETMKASGKPGLDRAAIEDYVLRFLPAYELYADTVARGRWSPDRQLLIAIDADRLPSST